MTLRPCGHERGLVVAKRCLKARGRGNDGSRQSPRGGMVMAGAVAWFRGVWMGLCGHRAGGEVMILISSGEHVGSGGCRCRCERCWRVMQVVAVELVM